MSVAKARSSIRFTLTELREIKETIETLLGDNEYAPGKRSSYLMNALNNAFDANAKIRPYYEADIVDSEDVDRQFTMFIGQLARATNIQNEVVESETIVEENIDLNLNSSVSGLEQRNNEQLKQAHTEVIKLIETLQLALDDDVLNNPETPPEADQ